MPSFLLLLLLATNLAAAAAAPPPPEPVKACDALKHLNQYEGRQVEMRGSVISKGHTTWLVPEKHCTASERGFLVQLPTKGKKRSNVVTLTGTISGRRGKNPPTFDVKSN